jgi:hypothetical protein
MNLKTVKTIVILIVAVFVGSAILLLSLKYEPEQKSTRRMIAEEEISIEWQWYRLTTNKILYAAMPAISGVSLLLFLFLFGLSFVRKQSVFHAHIGEHSDIPIHYRDLRDFYPVAVNLSLAEIEASVSQGADKAFHISEKILTALMTHSRALRPAEMDTPSQNALPVSVPTFRALLQEGVLAPHKPLIFGLTQAGHIKSGSWSDLFSSAIAGQSGQGKTSTLRSLIAQSLLTEQVALFWILDYHYPHHESLLASLGAVKDCQQVKYAENRLDTLNLIKEIDATLDTRLNGLESSLPVKVVVMDETLMLADRMPEVKNLIFRIGTEGRKAGMYGLFSAQTWKAQDVGGSDVRDNLTSIIAHRMKQRQAQTLLQDRENVKAVKHLSTGQALFVPTKGDPEILNIPLCTPGDMQEVSRLLLLSKNNILNASQPQGAIEIRNEIETTQKREETAETTLLVDVDILRETVVSWIETGKETISGLANKIEMNKGQVYRFTKGEQPSEALHVAFSSYYQKRAETP